MFGARNLQTFAKLEDSQSRAISWLKVPTRPFTFKTLLIYDAKWVMGVGRREFGFALRHSANQTVHSVYDPISHLLTIVGLS